MAEGAPALAAVQGKDQGHGQGRTASAHERACTKEQNKFSLAKLAADQILRGTVFFQSCLFFGSQVAMFWPQNLPPCCDPFFETIAV